MRACRRTSGAADGSASSVWYRESESGNWRRRRARVASVRRDMGRPHVDPCRRLDRLHLPRFECGMDLGDLSHSARRRQRIGDGRCKQQADEKDCGNHGDDVPLPACRGNPVDLALRAVLPAPILCSSVVCSCPQWRSSCHAHSPRPPSRPGLPHSWRSAAATTPATPRRTPPIPPSPTSMSRRPAVPIRRRSRRSRAARRTGSRQSVPSTHASCGPAVSVAPTC